MTAPIRVLIVDDSAAVRRLLSNILSQDPQLEVVATAANAATALDWVREGVADVVTLDVEMPDVNGLELLDQVRKVAPRLPVIMFSALTQRAAATTLDALGRGASDYVTKPSAEGGREAAEAHVRDQLVPKIKALARRHTPAVVSGPAAARKGRSAPIELVAIGASTGGPNALSTVFAALPQGFIAPIVVVQHMPPLFTRLLSERLSGLGPVKVREARDGEPLAPGLALVAPGDHHLRVVRESTQLVARLDRGPTENSCRPAVDVLFRSVAEAVAGHALAVVLTGMGQDGFEGCKKLAPLGAQIVAQDEATSVVWGMPGIVARGGLADAVVPLADVGPEIIRRVQGGARHTAPSPREVAHVGP